VKDHLPIEAYYHSTCGGRTECGAEALGRDLPYLPSVECGRCQDSPRARWTRRLTADELGRAAGLGAPAAVARVAELTPSGRAAAVEIASGERRKRLPAAELRQLVGFDRLPSLAFSVREEAGTFLFEGRGSGHGAGLCQWGAAGWAKAGKGYREILEKYYPGTEIVRMY
jgi:stage II sporulation protein D